MISTRRGSLTTTLNLRPFMKLFTPGYSLVVARTTRGSPSVDRFWSRAAGDYDYCADCDEDDVGGRGAGTCRNQTPGQWLLHTTC
eukprot:2839395-Rhodomonas_salina.1